MVSGASHDPSREGGRTDEFRLHPERPPVMRLSRRVILGLATFAALAVSGALIWALTPNPHKPESGGELHNTESKPTPDALASLPRDYASIPKRAPALAPGVPALGPPLPGDLGRPMLSAGVPAPDGLQGADPAQQKITQEQEAARTSKLFAPVNATEHLSFGSPRMGFRPQRPNQVTEHVYDSPTGKYLLIPQGSKLIGVYDSQIAFGQDRILLVWTRLILPNGRSIVLERQPGADPQGFAGLEDEVDHHWGRLAAAAALSTLLGVGAELGATNAENNLLQALRRGAATSLNQTGQQIVRRNLNIQPTLTIRPGFPVRVIVNRDLVLAPYRA